MICGIFLGTAAMAFSLLLVTLIHIAPVIKRRATRRTFRESWFCRVAVAQKPISCQFCHPIEGTRLFEKVSRSGNDFQLHFGAHFALRLFIERDHYLILTPDDE